MTGAGGGQRQRRNPWWKYRGGFSLTPQHHQQFSKSRPFLCLFWFNRSNPLSYLPIKIFQYNLSAHNIKFRVLAPLQNRFSLSRSLIFILSDIDLFVCGMNSTIILPTASSVSSVSVQQYSVLFFFLAAFLKTHEQPSVDCRSVLLSFAFLGWSRRLVFASVLIPPHVGKTWELIEIPSMVFTCVKRLCNLGCWPLVFGFELLKRRPWVT